MAKSMEQLYVVKDVRSLEVLGSFNNKREAKAFRDEKQGLPLPTSPQDFTFVISKGKDHPDFKGRK